MRRGAAVGVALALLGLLVSRQAAALKITLVEAPPVLIRQAQTFSLATAIEADRKSVV